MTRLAHSLSTLRRSGSPLTNARLGSGGRQLCRVGLGTHWVPIRDFTSSPCTSFLGSVDPTRLGLLVAPASARELTRATENSGGMKKTRGGGGGRQEKEEEPPGAQASRLHLVRLPGALCSSRVFVKSSKNNLTDFQESDERTRHRVSNVASGTSGCSREARSLLYATSLS